MPQNIALADEVWRRYEWCRDNGHSRFIEKADKCDRCVRGEQWETEDKAYLKSVKRPALTINKVLSTVLTVLGEQIYNRSEISFRPRSQADERTAEALTKVFKQISDNNQLDWKRSDMYTRGVITGRGFLDVRIDFNDSMAGEVRIDTINEKNVIVDPDAEQYDPDTWNEVFTTKWMTPDDIAVLFNRRDAELLRGQGVEPRYGYDSIEWHRDRFGDDPLHVRAYDHDEPSVTRNIRVIDRQYRKLDRQDHFLDPMTGDMRPIPTGWERDRIAHVREKYRLEVVKRLVRRIRWTTVADSIVLHDDWSPYKHFTVVPYFPLLLNGHTVGVVENLLGPQELLNKVSSQELHVVNTTANSGWKIKAGALLNMSIEELEQRGAQTGIVLELNELDGAEKITPNATPSGLDRISYKAEEHIKTISNVSDSMQGFDREDVAAKAIQTKRQASAVSLAKQMDSLTRTDFILARNILDLVQTFYSDHRVFTITKDRITGQVEQFEVNAPQDDGTFVNDLTLGEYDVIVSSVPVRESLEDTQFDHAVQLRELGVQIPDTVLIESSRLIRKTEILKQMQGDQESPEAQMQRELEQRGAQAEVAKVEAEAQAKAADAQLRQAKAGNEQRELEGADVEGEAEIQRIQFEHEREMARLEAEMALKREELEMKRQMQAQELALKQENEAVKRQTERIAAIQAAQNQPQPGAQTEGEAQ